MRKLDERIISYTMLLSVAFASGSAASAKFGFPVAKDTCLGLALGAMAVALCLMARDIVITIIEDRKK